MSEQMTAARLAEIRERANGELKKFLCGEFGHSDGESLVCEDVPALLDEIARLRAELEAAVRKDAATPPNKKWGCVYVCPPDCGGADGDEYGWIPLCPTCGYTSEHWEHEKRCPDCGQLINWSPEWCAPSPGEGEREGGDDERIR